MPQIGPRPAQQLNLLFFYGRGGAGKDTEADKLKSERTNLAVISTGDRIKAAQSPDNEFHYLVKDHMHLIDQGLLLPDEVVINLDNPGRSLYPHFVIEAINAGATTIISTGFPRKNEQLIDLDAYIRQLGQRRNLKVRHIYFDVSEDVARARSLFRPTEYKALGRTVRSDDNPETVERRLATFMQDTLPLLERLQREGRLVVIPAEGTKEQTHEITRAALGLHPALEISLPGREKA